MDVKKKIKFHNTYEFEGKTITGCEMLKPKLKHRNQAIKIGKANGLDTVDSDALMFSYLTELPREFFDEEIYQEDYDLIQREYFNFLGSSPIRLPI